MKSLFVDWLAVTGSLSYRKCASTPDGGNVKQGMPRKLGEGETL